VVLVPLKLKMYLSGREAFGKSECEGGSGLIFKFMA
jgi:hypothetical protein